jgi:integrase
MAVYRETYTKPVPVGAELLTKGDERHARWTDRRGRKRTAKVITGKDGSDRVVFTSNTHVARFRDGAGVVRKVGTGCRTKDAAAAVLTDLRGRAELVRANVLSPAQAAAADHAGSPIAPHVDAYLLALGRKACVAHVKNVRRLLGRLIAECGFGRPADLRREPLEAWLATRQRDGMSARTGNTYLSAAAAFAEWCRENDRLVTNPFADIAKGDERSDRRRTRRALTEDELSRLLTVARLRPFADFGRETEKVAADPAAPKRSNWRRAPLTFATVVAAADRGRRSFGRRPDFAAELERRGRERALVYKALVLTGLRKNELASLTVGQLDLDAERPYAILDAADEKNRQGSEIPLRPDLAADLRAWLADRLAERQADARLKLGQPVPIRLPPSEPVFDVPAGLVRILDRDLVAADIPKRDDRGRTVDVHAMRTTFGTHLSRGGVSLRTAQAAMRHSKPELTANIYTDPRLLDVAGALNVLPTMPLSPRPVPQAAMATGTEGRPPEDRLATARTLGRTLGQTPGNRSRNATRPDKTDDQGGAEDNVDGVAQTLVNAQTKAPLTTPVISGASGRYRARTCDLQRVMLAL